jgi:hypothetical protein
MFKKLRRRLRNSYQSIWGVFECCVYAFGYRKPLSTRSKPAKANKLCLLEMLHTTKKMKKNFCLFGANIFLEMLFGKKLYYDDHTKRL